MAGLFGQPCAWRRNFTDHPAINPQNVTPKSVDSSFIPCNKQLRFLFFPPWVEIAVSGYKSSWFYTQAVLKLRFVLRPTHLPVHHRLNLATCYNTQRWKGWGTWEFVPMCDTAARTPSGEPWLCPLHVLNCPSVRVLRAVWTPNRQGCLTTPAEPGLKGGQVLLLSSWALFSTALFLSCKHPIPI